MQPDYRPTEEQLHSATAALVATSRIRGLDGGVLEFDPRTLDVVGWAAADDWRPGLDRVWAPVPTVDAEELEATARRHLELGLEQRERCLEENARARFE